MIQKFDGSMSKLIAVFFVLLVLDLSAKVRILTFHCNKPEFIKIQHETLQKFLQDEYELIVINDAKTSDLEEAIQDTCDQCGIRCVRYMQEWHALDPLNFRIFEWLHHPGIYSYHWFAEKTIDCIANQPSVRHSHLLQYALDRFGYDHDDIVTILDGDVFPIRPFSIKEVLKDQKIVAVRKRLPGDLEDPLTKDQIDYLWVTFVAFHPRDIPDVADLRFQVDLINQKIYDTGAASYHYLLSHKDLRVLLFPRISTKQLTKLSARVLEKMGFNLTEIDFIKSLPEGQFVEFYVDQKLLHFANSSWDHYGHQEKTRCVQRFIDKIISEESQEEVLFKEALQRQYEHHCVEPSDINEHVPTLRRLAAECSSVVEIGIRSMVSSWGILQGLSENLSPERFYLGIDLKRPPMATIDLATILAKKNGISFAFWEVNDLDIDIPFAEMLFIDSLHTYCHLTYELEAFSPKISKYIAMHDTSAPWGNKDDEGYQGDYSEYSPHIDRGKKGLWPAVVDFLKHHPEWVLQERHFNNHGLTVLRRQ